jgi:hypothetical protein
MTLWLSKFHLYWKAEPFRQFEIHMSDGRVYRILSPDMVWVTPTNAVFVWLAEENAYDPLNACISPQSQASGNIEVASCHLELLRHDPVASPWLPASCGAIMSRSPMTLTERIALGGKVIHSLLHLRFAHHFSLPEPLAWRAIK